MRSKLSVVVQNLYFVLLFFINLYSSMRAKPVVLSRTCPRSPCDIGYSWILLNLKTTYTVKEPHRFTAWPWTQGSESRIAANEPTQCLPRKAYTVTSAHSSCTGPHRLIFLQKTTLRSCWLCRISASPRSQCTLTTPHLPASCIIRTCAKGLWHHIHSPWTTTAFV